SDLCVITTATLYITTCVAVLTGLVVCILYFCSVFALVLCPHAARPVAICLGILAPHAAHLPLSAGRDVQFHRVAVQPRRTEGEPGSPSAGQLQRQQQLDGLRCSFYQEGLFPRPVWLHAKESKAQPCCCICLEAYSESPSP